ncbi:MAG: hypothetical protein QM237_00305 [Bacteroidota bacterium]|nr:hypothetical protein [Bacteroidota bacterium]
MIFFDLFQFNFLNGRLLHVDTDNDFIGYDPIFSEPMDYPEGDPNETASAEYNILLDGDVFNVRIKYRPRRSLGALGLCGMEVFYNEEHLTTSLSISTLPHIKDYGSEWFFFKDGYYKISGGWDLFDTDGVQEEMIKPLDSVPPEEKFRQIERDKIYLVKYKTFTAPKSERKKKNKTIEDIVQNLLIKRRVPSYAISATLDAWDLQLVKKKRGRFLPGIEPK